MSGHTFNVLNLSTGELVNDYERNRATMYKQNPYKQRVASPIAVCPATIIFLYFL